MDDLIVIKPDDPFSARELFFAAVGLGALAWLVPLGADLLLGYVMGPQYRGTGLARAVTGWGYPTLVVLGAGLVGISDPRRGWCLAPVVAFVDVFLWIMSAALALAHKDLGPLEGLGQPLLRILALTVLPAAVGGIVSYSVRG